jgi:hypothetical protein
MFTMPMQQLISPTAITPNPLFVTPNLLYPRTVPLMQLPSIVSYPNLNTDSDLRRKVTEYFYDKLKSNWMKYHFLDLYQMIHVKDNTASLISNLSNLESEEKEKHANIKLQFLLNNYLSKNDLYMLLKKFVKINQLNWWDLKKHSDKVKLFIHHKISKYIKQEISNKK